MCIPKKPMALLLAVATAVALASALAYRTARWVQQRMRPAQTVASAAQNAPPKQDVSTAIFHSPPLLVRGDVMSKAFRSGQLPAALPMAPGDAAQVAAELAKRVIAADDQSTAALLTALRMSGFGLRAQDGSVQVESVKPGQGVLFDAWEVAAMAKSFGDGLQVKLADLGGALSQTLPPFQNAPMAVLLLAGVRAAAQGNDPAKRFWAYFIIELGCQSTRPYNLLAPELDLAGVHLDAVQVSLLLRRLAADVMIRNRGAGQKPTSVHPGRSAGDLVSPSSRPVTCDYRAGAGPLVFDAVWHGDHLPRMIRIQDGADTTLPCTLAELAAQILDSSAYLSGFGFDQLMEYLKEHGVEGAERYAVATSIANALLALVKLYAYFACLDTSITMSGEPPLVRTQSPYFPGERRTLTATVKENLGNWQALNCVRIALNGAGVDLSLPNAGPVAGAEIQWVLVGSGVFVNQAGAEAYLAQQILEFVSQDGAPRIQNAGGGAIQNFTAPRTDENGQATIDIEGTRQRPPLQGKPVPVLKQSEVRFTVAPKPMSLSQDVIDSIGNGYLAGPVGLAVGAAVEVLLRSNIHFSKSLVVPVQDWQDCGGGWSGTITYETTIRNVHNWSEGNNHYDTEADQFSERGEIQLNGSSGMGQGSAWLSHGTVSVEHQGKQMSQTHFPALGCTTKDEKKNTASGTGEVAIEIRVVDDKLDEISTRTLPYVDGEYAKHFINEGCPGKAPADEHAQIKYQVQGFPPVTVKVDPQQPGVLRGTTTMTEPQIGMIRKVSWNLIRCAE